MQSLNILDDREDQNYVGNEGSTKPPGVCLRKLKQGYMKEQREVEENHLAQHPLWLINNVHFCYDRDSLANNDNEKKQHKIELEEIHKREDKRCVLYTDSQSFMQSIEYNKENHPILNIIYDILAEL